MSLVRPQGATDRGCVRVLDVGQEDRLLTQRRPLVPRAPSPCSEPSLSLIAFAISNRPPRVPSLLPALLRAAR